MTPSLVIGLAAIVVLIPVAALLIALLLRRGRPNDSLLLQEQMTSLRQELKSQTELFNQTVTNHLQNQVKVMSDSQREVGTRLDKAAQVIGEVQGRLGKMEEASNRIFEIGKDIAGLQDILRAPKLRGVLGELFLGNLLSEMMPKDHFSLQHRFKNGEVVDGVIYLGDYLVPIDAKFPLENFRKMATATGDPERRAAYKLFATDVKRHIDAISSKYIRPDEGTFDFALMYIPAENVYYETIIKDDALGSDKELSHYALSQHVVPVSPNNFYAYLNTVLLGLRGFKLEKGIHEVIANLSRLKGEFSKFSDEFTRVGTHLNHARGSFESADKRLARFQEKLDTVEIQEGAGQVVSKPDEMQGAGRGPTEAYLGGTPQGAAEVSNTADRRF